MSKSSTLGIIIGNRDFFPDSLVETARTEVIALCQQLNNTPIVLDTWWGRNLSGGTKMCGLI